MRLYVMTRGLVRDYAFLGDEPPRAFWMAFRDATSFERPTWILLSDPTGMKLFASGVPSSRRDRVGTRIRFSLVLEADDHASAPLVDRLAAAWLAELDASDAGDGALARALDGALPEPLVEKALAAREGLEARAIPARLEEALDRLPSPDLPQADDPAPSWFAPAASPRARAVFLARTARLARGEEAGAALCLNLASTEAEASSALGKAPRGVVLLSALPGAGEMVPLQKKAVAPAPRRLRRAAIAIAIVVVNLAAGLALLRPW